MIQASPSIPIELMEILNKINDNINEVKQRIARIEGQEHSDSIKGIKLELEKERNERMNLQVQLATVHTKISAIAFVVPLIVTAALNLLIQIVT